MQKDYFKIIIRWLTRIHGLGLINSFRLFQNLKKDKLFYIEIDNRKIYLRGNSTDFNVLYSILFKNEYSYLSALDLKRVEVIIDAGANIGISTLLFKKRFPDAAIFAIEPEKTNFDLLKNNLAGQRNITLIEGALWHEDAHLKLKTHNTEKYAFQVEESLEQGINGYALSTLIKNYSLKKIDILKLDIEGAEKEIFMKDSCDWMYITKSIIIELHDMIESGCGHAFFSKLSNFKYSLYSQGENLFVKLDS